MFIAGTGEFCSLVLSVIWTKFPTRVLDLTSVFYAVYLYFLFIFIYLLFYFIYFFILFIYLFIFDS